MIRTYALNIGVNNPGSRSFQMPSQNGLKHCDDDARIMAALAKEHGFEREPVVLVDDKATYGNVVKHVREAIDYLKDGGVFLWTFSGHGTKIPPGSNRDGKYDEGWVLYDRILIDDCIRSLLAQFSPEATVIMVVDCCFSGGVLPYMRDHASSTSGTRNTRGTRSARGKRIGIQPAEKFLSDEVRSAHLKAFPDFYRGISCPFPPASVKDVKAAVIRIAACGEKSTTHDGIFTTELATMVRLAAKSGSEPIAGYRILIGNLEKKLLPQRPTLAVMGREDETLLKEPPFKLPVPPAGGYHREMAKPYQDETSEETTMAKTSFAFEPAQNSHRPPGASFLIVKPTPGEVITDPSGMLEFEVITTNFEIGPLIPTPGDPPCAVAGGPVKGGGQHIYVIIDEDQAYKIYDPETTLEITEGKTPDNGIHTLRAYLSRSWEESVKGTTEGQLFYVRDFYFNTPTGVPPYNRSLPMLALNAPLGEEDADGEYPYDDVPLDFFLMFQLPVDGYRIEATLMDRYGYVLHQKILNDWVPHCIRGIEPPAQGVIDEYQIRVRVVDHQGQHVPNGINGKDFNTIVHRFKVKGS